MVHLRIGELYELQAKICLVLNGTSTLSEYYCLTCKPGDTHVDFSWAFLHKFKLIQD